MRIALCTVLALLLAACSGGKSGAQTNLPTATLVIAGTRGPNTFHVEVAADNASRERGLMFRKTLAPDAGMLFDFHVPQFVTFWMKNTPLPLDMLFIRQDGTISTIAANTIPYSTDPIPSSEKIRAVLEINGGRAAELGITPGTQVEGAIFDHAAGRP